MSFPREVVDVVAVLTMASMLPMFFGVSLPMVMMLLTVYVSLVAVENLIA